MAYLHCHSCGWSQDDFYTKGYNPLTKVWNDIRWTIKPRIIKFDNYVVVEMKEYCYTYIYNMSGGVFSWNWLIVELERDIRSFLHMKWWTWDKWKVEKDTAVCPKCGDRNFDID